MRSFKIFAVVVPLPLLLATGSCRPPAPAQLGLDRTIRPAWIPSPNKSHPDYLYVTGACRGVKHRFLARSCALLDGERQLRQLTRHADLKVRGDFVEDEFFERRSVSPSSSELAYDWWVLVAFPRSSAGGAGAPATPEVAAGSDDERLLLERWRGLDAAARQAIMTLLERLAQRARP